MSPEAGHVAALWAMLMIGIFGSMLISLEDKRIKVLGIVWIIFWCSPPLITLWLKGVFG